MFASSDLLQFLLHLLGSDPGVELVEKLVPVGLIVEREAKRFVVSRGVLRLLVVLREEVLVVQDRL